MTPNDPFRLAPAPRRGKATPQPAGPGPVSYLLEQPGQPLRRLALSPRLASVLAQLAEPNGLAGGTAATAKVANELRAAGVLIVTVRQPRTDEGTGWTATYRLAAGQTITPEAE